MVRPKEKPLRLKNASWLQEARLSDLLALLNTGDAQTRVAGGAVRNAILGKPIADVDLATTLKPEEVSARARRAGFGVHPTGIAHGTVTVVVRRQPFEVTTLRRDVTTDGRRATVAFTDDWREDALRRDFTMNAMYCDQFGNIIDFTDGYSDCMNRRVKFVGAPTKRIREDYLRILRFFRFHAHYGKGAPDTAGLAACKRLRKGIGQLSAERISQELWKLLAAVNPLPVLRHMETAGIRAEVLSQRPRWTALRRVKPDPALRFFLLNGGNADFGPRIRLSKAEATRFQALAEVPAITPEFREDEQKRVLYALGPQAFADAVALAHASSRATRDEPHWRELSELPQRWPMPRFPLSGKDLLASGLAPGPTIGETLRKLEDWWIASNFEPSREDLIARSKRSNNA